MFSLSKKETEVMEILWDAGEPLARQDFLARAVQRKCSWKPNSIHILLNSLLDKGAIQVAGFYLNNRKLGRIFEPIVSREEYGVMQVRIALEKADQVAGLEPEKVLRRLLKEQKKKAGLP